MGCKTTKPVASADALPQPLPFNSKAESEFRAAWVATVANINWPSKPGLPVDSQKVEALRLLDFLKAHRFNAVIFQVRPQADALYQSALEPWSYYLTGQQGKAPSPYYDPLQFWTEEAHNRGIELHVWLNPYRAHHPSGGPVTDSSLVKRKANDVVYLKEGYWWFDPAKQETRDHSKAVVMDIVQRYDIDGVHFDDYFYPYPSYNKGDDFPDNASWAAYQASGGKLSRGDWRRESVNIFIEDLYKSIKGAKPWVKFGLSPFGIWRPGYPQAVEGFDQYEQLYADARLWLNKGWIDYFAPQLYWPIGRMQQSFPVLLGWWQEQNALQRHLWPGMSVGRDTSRASVNETIAEIMVTRGMLPQSKGAIHWSISPVMQNTVLQKNLLAGPYQRDALVPASPWLDNEAPAAPVATLTPANEEVRINWTHTNEKDVFRWVVYYQYGNRWDYIILDRNARSFSLKKIQQLVNPQPNAQPQSLKAIALTAVDRTGNESAKTVMDIR